MHTLRYSVRGRNIAGSPLFQIQRVLRLTTTSSVSPNEVDKFNSMHRDWWDPAQNVLIPMNIVRVGYIKSICQRHVVSQSAQGVDDSPPPHHLPLQNLTALDIGCGGGLLSESLARLGASVTGLDPSENLLEAARQHAQLDSCTRENIDYQHATAEEWAKQQPRQYDVVCLLEVIEHATDIPSLLRAATSMLHPTRGILFLSTINRTVASYLLTIVGAEYCMRYIPVGTHQWQQYQSPDQVELQLKACELEPLDVTGMTLEPSSFLWKQPWQWRLNPQDTSVNWIGAYRKRSIG